VTGDFLRKLATNAERGNVMHDMTRRKRTWSYCPVRASTSINRTPRNQRRGKPDKPAGRPLASRNASPPQALRRDGPRPATVQAVRR
jgi:hypothetical protein